MLEYCRGGTAASQRIAFAFAAHRIRVAGRSYADFAITVFGVAGAEGKAMGSACASASRWLQRVALCCNVSPCVAACCLVLHRGPVGLATCRHHRSIAPLSVSRALWRRPRGSDHVG